MQNTLRPQKQVFSTETASTVQSIIVASTVDNILSATLSVYGLTPADTNVDYYLSTGSQLSADWENIIESQLSVNYNGFMCFSDPEGGDACFVYGDSGAFQDTEDVSDWTDLSFSGFGNVIDFEVPVGESDYAGLITPDAIYNSLDFENTEICAELDLSGLNDLALGPDYNFAVGDNGLIVKMSGDLADPDCSIIPAVTTANLNAVSISAGIVSIYGDADDSGDYTIINSDNGIDFAKEDIGPGVNMNDLIINVDEGFAVSVGDSGIIWNQIIGFEPQLFESGTEEDLFTVNCSGLNCVLTGTNGTVLTSDDGGQTVTLYDLDLDVDIIDGAIFDSTAYGNGYFVLTDDNEIYFLPIDAMEADPWQGPIEAGVSTALPEGVYNNLQCFDVEEVNTCFVVGAESLMVSSEDLSIWTSGIALPVDDYTKIFMPFVLSDTKIYEIGTGTLTEICSNLTLSGLRHASMSNSDIGYAVGDDGLLVLIDDTGGSPVCSIVDPLTTSNLNFVQKIGDTVFVLGDVDEEGEMLTLVSADEETFSKQDNSGSPFDPVDINSLSYVADQFIVYVGDNGTILVLDWGGQDTVLIPSNTTENLTSGVCNDAGACIVVGENGTVITSEDGFETVVNHDLGISADILSASFFEGGDYAEGYIILTDDDELYYLPVGVGGGYVWEGPITPGVEWVFENAGTDLLWKAELSTDDTSATPVLYDMSLSYSTNDIIVCTDCHLDPPTTPNRLEPTVVSPTSIQWNFADTSGVEYGFRLYDEVPTLISDVGSANLSYIVEAGLSPNTRYLRKITAYNGDGESSSAELGPIYTYANTPSIDTLVVTGNTSCGMSINENSNSNITKYSIYETSLSKWLQADSTLGTSRVFRTYNQWLGGGSNIAITGLTNNAMYAFKVQAQNGDGEETDFSATKSIVVYRPETANLVVSKKVGVNLVPHVAGVYMGQAVFAGTDTAQKIKLVPLVQRYANIYTILAGLMVLLFLVLLILNARPKMKHLKHLHKVLLTDLRGKKGDHFFELLHGKDAAKHGAVYKNHHHFYHLTNLGFAGVLFGFLIKLIVVGITAFLVYSTVQVQAFENQSGVDVKVGDKLTYQIEYLNNGGTTAHAVVVTEPIPAGSTFVAGTLTSTGNKCTYANNSIACNVGELATDAKGVLEFQVTVTGAIGNTIINIASSTYAEGTGVTNSNSTTNAIVGIPKDCVAGAVCEVTLGPGWNFFRMEVGSKVSFAHNGANHAVELTSSKLTTKKSGLRITSEPVNVSLEEDVIAGVDSNGNTYNDLEVMIQTVESDTVSVVGIKEIDEDIPLQPVCGDTQCNGTETCSTCAGDCGVCAPVCGDLVCNGAETCNTCAGDCGICPPVAVCGDHTCNGTETCNSCSQDCGICPPLAVCGDDVCNGTETCTSCSQDCGACIPGAVCGDATCNGTETCNSCSQDCGVCVIDDPDVAGGITYTCSDNLDNDGDGKTDYPEDPGCVSLTDTDETDEITIITETEDQIINVISTIVSGLTQKDYAQVREEVVKTIKSIGDATINNKTVEKVNNIAQEPVAIVATVASIASIASVGATGAAGVGLLTYLQFLFTQPLMLLRKKKQQNWGVIYNSITKAPLDLAIIRLFEIGTNRLVSTRVSDIHGRYQFMVKPGRYYIEVNKNQHKFPSEVIPQLIGLHVAGGASLSIDDNIVDGEYQHLYNGGVIEVKLGENGIINKAIPVDPNRTSETDKQIFRKRMWNKIQTWSTLLGPIIAFVSFVINPQIWIG
ncbi:MAG: hypothetical protein UT02_C0053G0002, partial [Parcubacteria group bacterium GW2011_GWC2_38_7]